MKFSLALCGLLLTSVMAHASVVLVTGSPSDSFNSPAITQPSPNLGGDLLNFDSLSPLDAAVIVFFRGSHHFQSRRPGGVAL